LATRIRYPRDERFAKQVADCTTREHIEAVRHHTEYLASARFVSSAITVQVDYHRRMIAQHLDAIENTLDNLLDVDPRGEK
jgi:hypothetical protein